MRTNKSLTNMYIVQSAVKTSKLFRQKTNHFTKWIFLLCKTSSNSHYPYSYFPNKTPSSQQTHTIFSNKQETIEIDSFDSHSQSLCRLHSLICCICLKIKYTFSLWNNDINLSMVFSFFIQNSIIINIICGTYKSVSIIQWKNVKRVSSVIVRTTENSSYRLFNGLWVTVNYCFASNAAN